MQVGRGVRWLSLQNRSKHLTNHQQGWPGSCSLFFFVGWDHYMYSPWSLTGTSLAHENGWMAKEYGTRFDPFGLLIRPIFNC